MNRPNTKQERMRRMPVSEYDDTPILDADDLTSIEEWVRDNVRYLLHQAPADIDRAVDADFTAEDAEAIICARTTQRLVELVYATHGVPLELLWEVEAREKAEERERSTT
jgi:hypothetical protein